MRNYAGLNWFDRLTKQDDIAHNLCKIRLKILASCVAIQNPLSRKHNFMPIIENSEEHVTEAVDF